jgi:hypothetical protein
MAGEFDAQTPDEITCYATEVFPKFASEMDRIAPALAASSARGVSLIRASLCLLVNSHPGLFVILLRTGAGEFGRHLERQPFYRQTRPRIAIAKLVMQPQDKRSQRTSIGLGRLVRQVQVLTRALPPLSGDLDAKDPDR